MKKNSAALMVLAWLCAGYVLLVIGSAPLLPERMATHFTGNGEPDGWMSRSADLTFMAVLGAILPLLFIALSSVIGFMPARLVNLPHREYWLAPERLAQTRAVISRQMIWMACLMVLFLAGIHCLMIQANRSTPPHLSMTPFLILVGAFFAAIMIWSIVFIRHFTKTAS